KGSICAGGGADRTGEPSGAPRSLSGGNPRLGASVGRRADPRHRPDQAGPVQGSGCRLEGGAGIRGPHARDGGSHTGFPGGGGRVYGEATAPVPGRVSSDALRGTKGG